MTRLILDDISRCAGRFGLGPDDPVCERREQCARYVQLRLDHDAMPDGLPRRISVFTALCTTRPGDHDFFIRVEPAE